MNYTAAVTREGKYWLAEFPDAPGCQTFAESEEELRAMAKEAIEGWLEAHLVSGEVPPRPRRRIGKGLRVNIEPGIAVAIEIRWARIEQGLTQAELARRVGVSQPQIAKLEKPGENPSIETLKKIAAALNADAVVTFVPKLAKVIALDLKPARRATKGGR